MTALVERIGPRVNWLFGRLWFWMIVVVFSMTLPVVQALRAHAPVLPPVVSKVPDFRFTDQHGQPFGNADLRGKVWIANFVFTRCPTVCPTFTETMARVQHRLAGLGDEVHLVSFSVDPGHDTPERLAAYADEHHAGPRWSFLTGPTDALEKVVVDGFKLTLARDQRTGEADFMSIVHGVHFVLVDRDGNIRGYYDSQEPAAVDALVANAGLLANAR
jgi:protein SCO1/2